MNAITTYIQMLNGFFLYTYFIYFIIIRLLRVFHHITFHYYNVFDSQNGQKML